MDQESSSRPIWMWVVLILVVLGPVRGYGQTEAESLSASFRKASRRVLPAVVTVRPADAAAPAPSEPVPRIAPIVPEDPLLPMPRAAPVAPGGPLEWREVPFPQTPAADGSGVVINAAKGWILTNDHLVTVKTWVMTKERLFEVRPTDPRDAAPAPRIVVTLPDGRERVVKEVRRDPKSDLALLMIEPGGLQQAEWGDSEAMEIGDWVLAIGQPFGLSGTVTAGIVSSKGRGVGVALYEDLIQTDAAINPGNSGGPLVNLKGEVVGINAAIKSRNGGNEGVGFAIPSARARRVAAELAEFGRVRRAYIGVAIRRIDPAAAERVGNPGAVAITNVVPGSPAAKADLRPGDLITALKGMPIQGVGMLQAAIEVAPVGEPLTLTLQRDGQSREVQVRPADQPESFGRPEPAPEPRPIPSPEASPRPESLEARRPSRFPELGLRLGEPTPERVQVYGLDPATRGLVVLGVEPDSPADRGGLEVGMVITDAADRKVSTLAEFRSAIAKRPADRDLVLRVLKGQKAEFRVIPDPSRPKEAPAQEPLPVEPPANPPPEPNF